MAKKALITYDIITALDWLLTAPGSAKKDDPSVTWKEQAQKDWYNKLNRVWGEMGDAAQAGINYEKEIYRLAGMHKVVGSPEMQKTIELCIGGEFQSKIKKDVVVAGEECFLFGKCDVLFPDKILDIKTTAKFSEEKYSGSFQHLLYCYITGIKDFQYVVTQWAPSSTLEVPVILKTHVIESGFWGDAKVLEKKVFEKITWFIESVKSRGDWELYKEKYCLY